MSFLVFLMVFLSIRVLLLGKVQIVLGDPSEVTLQSSPVELRNEQDGAPEDGTPPLPSLAEEAPSLNVDEMFSSDSGEGTRPAAGKGRRSKGHASESKDGDHLPKDWRKYLRPDIDVIMNKDELTKIDSSGEVEFKANKYGQPYVDLKVRTHGGFRRVQLERAFLPFLPESDWGGDNKTEARYKTCALVGNSGTNIGTGQGEDIDRHDAVIRINYAPTKRFEYDVGNKTTFDIANKENCLKLAKGDHKWRRPPSTLIMWEAHSRVIRNQVYLKVLKSRGVQGKKLWLLSPAVVTVSRMVWLTIKKDIEEDIHGLRLKMSEDVGFDRTLYTPFVFRKSMKLGPAKPGDEMFSFHSKPMSGIVSLFFAIQVCDSVDLYGFDPFTNEAKSRYHYFDDRAGMVNVHSFDMALEIFRRISKAFPMRIHSRANKINSFAQPKTY
ncbi:sialyltransferase [Chloropicon primus]|uniref:Sialyltransferase n=1 Tax=Chloropicon primus TaxID=1764295 RepID=A0A5B8MVH3_9CHLO|nr:sialyltransferase [Chloropicon primus]UPR02927.1 sialyltransferase [Chloropicon primus]|eukprot:QDZ23714.1 sialyltransferase [Chloropicon primus]